MIKKHFLFLLLIPFIIYIQLELLEPHLKYGFSDVDWGFLNFYIKMKKLHPNILDNVYNTFQTWGVYTHQSYYIGLMHDVYGLDYKSFQLTTNVFKILATIFAYPFFYILTKKYLVALIGTFLFAISYPTVGTMYTTVTSSDYSAVLICLLFLWLYIYIIKKNEKGWLFMLGLFILLHATLFLSTERMNPLIFLIFCAEAYIYIKKRQLDLKRWVVLFLPTFLIMVTSPQIVIDFVGSNGVTLIRKIYEGNLHLMLNPLISLGSLVVPHDHWRYFGIPTMSNLSEFIKYYLQIPFLFFSITSVLIGLIILKKKILFIVQMLFLTFIMGELVFLLVLSKGFNISFLNPALIGGFIMVLGIIIAFHFIKYQRESMLLGIFLGIFSAFVFILITWLGADIQLVFTGVHRYLTMPALFICLSLGCLFALFIERISNSKKLLKPFIIVPILVILAIIPIWTLQINEFFKDELRNGFGAEDKNLMRNQLLEQTKDLSTDQPSLFYFDFLEDHDRGYYYDNTLLGGFSTWMMWHPNINFNEELKPYAFWNDFNRLKSAYILEGEEGFFVNEKFYTLEQFYAFKLKDKRIINIKEEILKRLPKEFR